MDTTQPHSRPVGSQLGRRLSMVAILAVIGMLAAPPPLGGAATAQTTDCSFRNGLGSFNSPEVLPGACWRPYSDASPFNRAIPKKSRVARGSKAMVRRLLSGGRASYMRRATRPGTWHPDLLPGLRRPALHAACYRPWGTCEIEGHQIRAPAQRCAAEGYATAETTTTSDDQSSTRPALEDDL